MAHDMSIMAYGDHGLRPCLFGRPRPDPVPRALAWQGESGWTALESAARDWGHGLNVHPA